MEAHEGFSIREYVSRMRTVNVVKCWPFDEATTEESVKSLLPPITVKKFIWWLDGLDYLHSQNLDTSKRSSKKKKNKVLVVQEKGESSFGNEEAVEERKAKASRPKAKAPKKRSILEIFAVAPPVERVLSSEEEDSAKEEDGFSSRKDEINWGVKGKRNEKNNSKKKKLKKSKDVILNKAKKVIKKIKKKKRKKAEAKIDQSVSSKENCFMFKQKDPDKDNGIPDSPNEMEKVNDNITYDPISLPTKQPRAILQHLDGDTNSSMPAACKAFALIAKSQHPKRGILRNHAKEISPYQPTKCILLQESTEKSDKHVTFFTNGSTGDVSDRFNESEVEIRSLVSSNAALDHEMNDLGTSGPGFPPMWFKEYLETHNEPSNKRCQGFPQTNAFNVPYGTLPYFSPKELLQNVYSPLERENEDFVGLPLNSQGELIRLSSSDKRDFNQLNLFPVKGYSEETPVVLMQSRKTINDHSFDSETSICKQDYRFSHGNEKIIPKMRLMGKEFTIGGRDSQGFEDDSIWKDKQIINEQLFNTSTSMRNDNNEQSLGKLRDFYPSEVKTQHSYSFPHFDRQTSSMQLNNGFTARNPSLPPVAIPAVYSSESLFRIPSSDIQLKNKQNLSHAPRSAIRFPFMHPDLEGHANRAPLYFDAPENGTLMSHFQTHNHSGGPSHWTESSVSQKSEPAYCLYNPYSSVAPISSVPTTLLTRQEPMLCYPGIIPISSVQKRNINQKKINSRIAINRGFRHGKRAKSQLPGVSNLSQCAFPKSTTSDDFEDVEEIETAMESCAATNDLIYDEYVDDQNATRIPPWCVGPIKLAAGAKHILKACQQIDLQNGSRPINTNSIPLNAANAGFRFS